MAPRPVEHAGDGGVYQLARLELESLDAFLEYGRAVLPLVSAAGGRVLAVSRGGDDDSVVVEGARTTDVIVLSWWPSREAFDRFYTSAEYAPWRAKRHRFARTELLLLSGF